MNEKDALAKVFGVTKHDNLIIGVPITAPDILRTLQDKSKLKMVKGLPKDFTKLMTDEQKAEFKALIKRNKK